MLRRVYIVVKNVNNALITINDSLYNYGDSFEENSILNIEITAIGYINYSKQTTISNSNILLVVELKAFSDFNLDAIYPVGSIYITTLDYCPLEALGIGTWQKVGEGRVLQMASSNQSADTILEAGLPNIAGNVYPIFTNMAGFDNSTGCFSNSTHQNKGVFANGSSSSYNTLDFDASKSNAIYGNSTTVQPPAYLINNYKRVS